MRFVFTFSSVPAAERKRLEKEAQKCFGSRFISIDTPTEALTHVIVHKIVSTEKVMYAAANGCWIMPVSYLTESIRHGDYLDEKSFLFALKEAELMDSLIYANTWALRRQTQCPKPFSNWDIVFIADSADSPTQKVIEVGGAKSLKVILSDNFEANETKNFEEDQLKGSIVICGTSYHDLPASVKEVCILHSILRDYLLFGVKENISSYVAFPTSSKLNEESFSTIKDPANFKYGDVPELNKIKMEIEIAPKNIDINISSSIQSNDIIVLDFLSKFINKHYNLSADNLIGLFKMLFTFEIPADMLNSAYSILLSSFQCQPNSDFEVDILFESVEQCKSNLLTLFFLPLEEYSEDDDTSEYILRYIVDALYREKKNNSFSRILDKAFIVDLEDEVKSFGLMSFRQMIDLIFETSYTCKSAEFDKLCMELLAQSSEYFRKKLPAKSKSIMLSLIEKFVTRNLKNKEKKNKILFKAIAFAQFTKYDIDLDGLQVKVAELMSV